MSYDPAIGRFISPDSFISTGQGLTGYNMYAYCGNNHVMRVDINGNSWKKLFLPPWLDDVKAILNGDVSVEVSDENVEITNSHLITNPFIMYGYSFYLNHINDETKDIIEGTTQGVVFEWQLHNIAYVATLPFVRTSPDANKYNAQAGTLDIGPTIFSDNHDISIVMFGAYLLVSPSAFLIDYVIDIVN